MITLGVLGSSILEVTYRGRSLSDLSAISFNTKLNCYYSESEGKLNKVVILVLVVLVVLIVVDVVEVVTPSERARILKPLNWFVPSEVKRRYDVLPVAEKDGRLTGSAQQNSAILGSELLLPEKRDVVNTF